MENASQSVIKNAKLCAEQGWRGTFVFKSGETIECGYITATDFDQEAVVVERVGERHLKPRLVYLNELSDLKPDWS